LHDATLTCAHFEGVAVVLARVVCEVQHQRGHVLRLQRLDQIRGQYCGMITRVWSKLVRSNNPRTRNVVSDMSIYILVS